MISFRHPTSDIRHVLAVLLVLAAASQTLAGPPGATGDLYVPSGDTHSVKQFDGVTGAAAGTFVPTASGGLNNPVGIAFGASGNLFVTSYNNDQIIQYDGNTGALIGTFGIGGGLDGPYGIAFGSDGNLYACSFLNARVVRFDGSSGAAMGTFATGGGLGSPMDLTFGPGGDLFVSSFSGSKVLRYSGTTGAFVSTFAIGGGLSGPAGLTFGPTGNLFVASFNNNQIIQFDGTTGAPIGVFASGGGLAGPFGIAFGPDGNLYVASYNNDRVLRYSGTNGAFIDNFVPTVTNPGHLKFKTASGPFPAPDVTGFGPNAAANCGVVSATIDGVGFASGIGFKLKRAGQTDIAGAITNLTATQATVSFNLAGVALGLWDVEARYPDGQNDASAGVLDVSQCAPPTARGVVPGSAINCGPLNGATVSGSGFLAGATVKLSRAGQSDIVGTSVVVTPPATITANFATTGAAVGLWDVTVTNPGGSGTHTLVGGLNVTQCPPPVVGGINPNSVTNCGALNGASISGSNFLAGATVKLARSGQSDIPGTSVVIGGGGTTITANFATTGAAVGAWDVVVTNPGGSGSGSAPGSLQITICPPPVVTNFSPGSATNCGTLSGAAIIGSNFLSGATVKLTRSGLADINGTSVIVGGGGTTITASFNLAGAAVGMWDCVVANPGGSGATTFPNAVNLAACPPPNITSIDTTAAPNCGSFGEAVHGSGFQPGKSVSFVRSGQPAIVCNVGADQLPNFFELTCSLVGAAPGMWDLRVVNPDGQSATLTGALEITACPPLLINSAWPRRATNSFGTLGVVVEGGGFMGISSVQLKQGVQTLGAGSPSAFSNRIGADFTVTPANSGYFDLVVTRHDGATATLPAAIELVNNPHPDMRIKTLGSWGGEVTEVFVDPATPGIAYVAVGRRLVILDVSNMGQIVEIGSIDLGNLVKGVKVRGGYAYVVTFGNVGPNLFCVVNVVNAAAPQLVWSTVGQSNVDLGYQIELGATTAYVRTASASRVYSLSNPASPSYVGNVGSSIAIDVIRVAGDRLYALTDGFLKIYDASAPGIPPLIATSTNFAHSSPAGRALAVDGTRAYAAAGADVLAVLDVANPASPVVLGVHNRKTTDLAASGGLVYQVDGGLHKGANSGSMVVLDFAANPSAPTTVGQFHSPGSSIGHINHASGRAFLGDCLDGLVIVDVTNSAAPTRIGSYYSPAYLSQVCRQGDRLYVTDFYGGFNIVDVADPRRPLFLGAFRRPDRSDHIENFGIVVRDNLAYLAAGYFGLEIVDVSDPANPILVGEYPFDFNDQAVARAVELDGTLLRVGLYVPNVHWLVNFDVSDPSNPFDIGSVVKPGSTGEILTSSDGISYCSGRGGIQVGGTVIADSGAATQPLVFSGLVCEQIGFCATAGIARLGNVALAPGDIWGGEPDYAGGLGVLDARNPQNIEVVGRWFPSTTFFVSSKEIEVNGNIGVTLEDDDLYVLDLTDLANPMTLQRSLRVPGARDLESFLASDGRLIYNLSPEAGLTIFDIGLPGDFDGSLDVGALDLARFVDVLRGVNATDVDRLAGDMDDNGSVDGLDIQPFIQRMLSEVPPVVGGACCMRDGTCIQGLNESWCTYVHNGIYQGDGATCAGITCPPTGACCVPFGNVECAMQTQATCLAQGGTYHGDGVACETVACRGACCNSNDGSCHERSPAACAVTNGNYQGDGVTCASSSCPYGRYENEANPIQFFRASGDSLTIADDMTLAGTGARELNYLDLAVYGNSGGPFTVYVELYASCPWPAFPIPDAFFAWENVVDDGSAHLLSLDPAPPGIILPDTVWMTVFFSTPEAGWLIAGEAEVGSTENRYGTLDLQSDFCNAGFSNIWAGLWANIRCQPSGALTTRGQWNKPTVPTAEVGTRNAEQPSTADAPKMAAEQSAPPRFVEHKGRQYRVIDRMKKLEGAGKPVPVTIQPQK